MRVMMQKVGDRDKPTTSVKEIAFCVNANPMSDRMQMVVEIYEHDTETWALHQAEPQASEQGCGV